MTERVVIIPPDRPSIGSLYVNRPVLAAGLSTFSQRLAHMVGAQLTQVLAQLYGKQELPIGAGDTTIRVRHRAGANARRAVIAMVPYGYTGSGPGTVELVGALGTDTLDVTLDADDSVTNLADATQILTWTKELTPGAYNEHIFSLTDVRPHSLLIYEAPVAKLIDDDMHVDASIGDPSKFITNDNATDNPRGYNQLLTDSRGARTEMRRHVFNWGWPYMSGVTGGVSGSSGYLIGSATSGHGVRTLCRDVRGNGETEMPVNAAFYVADRDTGTFDISIETGAAGSPYAITGIATTGWKTADIEMLIGIDTLKVQVTRTGGAGQLTLVSGEGDEDT